MPRRPASRSLSTDLELQTPAQIQAQRSSNQAFVARFLGETSGMDIDHTGKVQDDDGNGNGHGDINGDVEMGGSNGHHDAVTRISAQGGPSSTSTGPRASKRKHADMEDAPINMSELRLRQLREDYEAYSYDIRWTQSVLDAEDLTPAEQRSYQLRQLDLGHQLRMTSHTIAQIEADMQNMRYYSGNTSQYARPAFTTALHPRTSFLDAEPPQERRGPGRPPGSKNRPKDAATPVASSFMPQAAAAPSSNAQKAAALASAGAKRILPTEIRVATRKSLDALSCESCVDCHRLFAPGLHESVDMTCALGHRFVLTTPHLANGDASASGGGGAGGAAEGSSKRPRVEVGSPIGSTTEDENDVNETTNAPAEAADNETVDDVSAKTTTGRRTARARDITKDEAGDQSAAAATPTGTKKRKNANASTPSGSALPTRTPLTGKKNAAPSPGNDSAAADDATTEPETPGAAAATASTSSQQPDQTGPGGAKYQRLGHHMCQLCTSQKYLTQSTPKQPSEPSSWPLRDVSKMVTHYTRMHGEHNKMERCMELGRALEDNRGPFRYWLQETKRVKVPLVQVNEAIQSLHQGRLPDLLRRLSNAAKAFPQD